MFLIPWLGVLVVGETEPRPVSLITAPRLTAGRTQPLFRAQHSLSYSRDQELSQAIIMFSAFVAELYKTATGKSRRKESLNYSIIIITIYVGSAIRRNQSFCFGLLYQFSPLNLLLIKLSNIFPVCLISLVVRRPGESEMTDQPNSKAARSGMEG